MPQAFLVIKKFRNALDNGSWSFSARNRFLSFIIKYHYETGCNTTLAGEDGFEPSLHESKSWVLPVGRFSNKGLAGELGIEPNSGGPTPPVLPLDDSPIMWSRDYRATCPLPILLKATVLQTVDWDITRRNWCRFLGCIRLLTQGFLNLQTCDGRAFFQPTLQLFIYVIIILLSSSEWWTRRELNPIFLIASEALYQLSYRPVMVPTVRFELTLSSVWSWCLCQLGYAGLFGCLSYPHLTDKTRSYFCVKCYKTID